MSTTEFDEKMYFVINDDLKMGKGKIAGQVGHATAKLSRLIE
jgi:peptidyl-tRNA hydrolase